jgi:hypothetical protein
MLRTSRSPDSPGPKLSGTQANKRARKNPYAGGELDSARPNTKLLPDFRQAAFGYLPDILGSPYLLAEVHVQAECIQG